MNKKNIKIAGTKTGQIIFFVLTVLAFLLPAFPSYAVIIPPCCSCENATEKQDEKPYQEAEDKLNQRINDDFLELEHYIVHDMYEKNILPAMMLAAEQFTAVAMQQALIIGTFFDAQNQMQTQLLLQELRAKAAKDYRPSTGICELGTSVRGLDSAENKMPYTAFFLAQYTQDRQLGNTNTAGMYGFDLDKENRINQFKEKFCDEYDRNTGLAATCASISEPDKINQDIDFHRLIDSPMTLDIDFTNTDITDDEEAALALANNLFAHNLFPRAPAALLKGDTLNNMKTAYLDIRALVAKRSVAQNSFNAIVALKAQGKEDSKTANMLQKIVGGGVPPLYSALGLSPSKAEAYVGTNPSYYAQMDLITKKIYENPEFYVNLYDTPANVKRKGAALQAIKLMQKFDMLDSSLRNEAAFSVLLEMAITDLQKEVEDSILSPGSKGN